jgi:hypothetical protein
MGLRSRRTRGVENREDFGWNTGLSARFSHSATLSNAQRLVALRAAMPLRDWFLLSFASSNHYLRTVRFR